MLHGTSLMSRRGLACVHRTIHGLAGANVLKRRRARLVPQRRKTALLPRLSDRSNDRKGPLLDLIRCVGVSPRRSALKHPLVRHREAIAGITASIAKLTKSAGTSEPSERTEPGAASSKAIDVCLSARRQTRSIPLRLGGTGGDRYVVTVTSWRPTARRQWFERRSRMLNPNLASSAWIRL